MSLFPDITPLVKEIQEFKQQQILTNQLLSKLLVAETNNEKHLSQIKELLKK